MPKRARPNRRSGAQKGIVVKIERKSDWADFYHITVAAGQKLEPEMAKRGTLVPDGPGEWFRLTRCETPKANRIEKR